MRQREAQRDRVDAQRGQVLAQDDVEVVGRQREEQFVGPLPPLVGPEVIVIAGMKNRSRYGIYRFSWSRFARLLVKNTGCQNATARADKTNSVMKT